MEHDSSETEIRVAETTSRSPAWLRVVIFILVYAVIQYAYQGLRAGSADPWFIRVLIARPAATLIDWVRPADFAFAAGPRLVWPGGSLTLLAGCDGFEVMGLFVAAMLVADVSWRRGIVALTAGCVLVWALNQLRILGLYLAARHRPEWFDALHTEWGPLMLVCAVVATYAWAVHWSPRGLTTSWTRTARRQ